MAERNRKIFATSRAVGEYENERTVATRETESLFTVLRVDSLGNYRRHRGRHPGGHREGRLLAANGAAKIILDYWNRRITRTSTF
jgi:hypothetical protein